ncbi:hypothetical protein PK35_13835 [Tamlana nanhaiensis]|uniref:Uncharacterized protein n=1 Tax=Neotamlana nanhaiensis TaxID=1382798 RepID=A0A0D7W0W7_9FLAO|nr:hypothetical protein [Tamlana nanhaiensis]KJD31492.1 hypothetical protein PK35_13835 [Tamlana nanhaiensis]
MKKIGIIITLIFSIVLFTDCKENDDTPAILSIDYVGFESDFQIGVDPSGTVSKEVKIAVSQLSGSERTFNLSINSDLTTANPSAYSIPSSVSIPANSKSGSFLVEVIGTNVNASGNDLLVINIIDETENLFISDPISLNLKQVCPNPELILDITFDTYPEEIYWVISDESDNTVFESITPAAYGAYTGLTGGITRNMCLQSGTYTFTILDGYEDGAGPFTLTLEDGTLLGSSDGAYGAGTTITFTIP